METVKVLTLNEIVADMKSEILDDVKKGVVPRTVGSFSELHDFGDANYYGGFCNDDIEDALITYFGGRNANEGLPDGFVRFMNDAQNAVDLWIKEGGLL